MADSALTNFSIPNCSPGFPEILFKALLQQRKMMPEEKGELEPPVNFKVTLFAGERTPLRERPKRSTAT